MNTNEATIYTTPEGQDYPRYYMGCNSCERYRDLGQTFFPSHTPSAYCESGGRPHCTCDWCF